MEWHMEWLKLVADIKQLIIKIEVDGDIIINNMIVKSIWKRELIGCRIRFAYIEVSETNTLYREEQIRWVALMCVYYETTLMFVGVNVYNM
jgi:hypothetical protein